MDDIAGLHYASEIARKEFENAKACLAVIAPDRRLPVSTSPCERLRWLNLRAVRLDLRLSMMTIVRRLNELHSEGRTLPPLYRILAPRSLQLLRDSLKESHPRSIQEWRERRRLQHSMAVVGADADDLDEFAEQYARRMTKVRNANRSRAQVYAKNFRSNFWKDSL